MKKHEKSGLYVTKDGNVFKLARISSYGHRKGCLYCLNPFIASSGYPAVTTYNPNTQESINWNVHQLVAETYLEPVEGKPYVDHKDRNKMNSCLSNLHYVSQSENNINREVSDAALSKWGFHPCEDRKRYKAAWARADYAKRKLNASRVDTVTAPEKAA